MDSHAERTTAKTFSCNTNVKRSHISDLAMTKVYEHVSAATTGH